MCVCNFVNVLSDPMRKEERQYEPGERMEGERACERKRQRGTKRRVRIINRPRRGGGRKGRNLVQLYMEGREE